MFSYYVSIGSSHPHQFVPRRALPVPGWSLNGVFRLKLNWPAGRWQALLAIADSTGKPPSSDSLSSQYGIPRASLQSPNGYSSQGSSRPRVGRSSWSNAKAGRALQPAQATSKVVRPLIPCALSTWHTPVMHGEEPRAHSELQRS